MIRIERGGYGVTDAQLEALLRRVYVEEGFTDPAVAERALAAPAVRARGELLFAFASMGELAGMITVVMPASPARRIAAPEEAELHLLAVLPEFRGQGIASHLVEEACEVCRRARLARVVLWTQPTMHAAQRLYLRHGFTRRADRDASLPAPAGRAFLVFERQLEAL